LIARDPYTEEIIYEKPTESESEVTKKLAKAQATYREMWKKTTFEERAAYLNKVAAVMRDEVDYFAMPMVEEMGKPIKEARGEVLKSAWCAEHYAEYSEAYLATEHIASDATKSYVQYLPLGTVLGVLPWNAPFWLAFRFCTPALMAGNTCVMKHDSHVPKCAEAIEQAFIKAGVPEGVFQNLAINSSLIEPVVKHDAIKAVSFTGSDMAGSKIAALAASQIKPCVLELGGSDPSIVLADANLEEAADVICLSRIINAGQSCIAAKRIIVEEAVYESMIELLKTRFAKLKLGDPREESTDVGPIARQDLRDGLHRQVEASVKAGARVLLGGQIPEGKGYFYPVTMLADVTPDMLVSCEETFGPIAVVMKVKDAKAALELANNTPYGLGASIWTEVSRGEAMAKEIEAGQVSVNGIVKTDPRLPSGGVKRSGYGRELGPHGIKMFVNAQQIWICPKKA
jgi:succinate-semialdehyde dehydrogenase/glutarate-semialdehyde dehydrogenase